MKTKNDWTTEEANAALKKIDECYPNLKDRELAFQMNSEMNTDWWDGERVRDRRRKMKEKSVVVPKIPTETHVIKSIGKKRILVLADIHFPYHREDIYEIFENNILSVDGVVFAGDIFDNEGLSQFPAISKRSFDKDIMEFHEFISKLNDMNTNNVPMYFIRGNHEERLAKYIAQNQQKELNKFINPQIIQMLVEGFNFYEGYDKLSFEPIKNIVYINNWFLNINNTVVICHQKDFHKPKLKTVCEGINYFMEIGEKFEAVFLAHMHIAGYTRNMGKHGYNIPCLCKPQEYTNNGKFQYRPQAYGYTIITLDENGKFDVNNTKIEQLPEKYKQINEKVEYNISI